MASGRVSFIPRRTECDGYPNPVNLVQIRSAIIPFAKIIIIIIENAILSIPLIP